MPISFSSLGVREDLVNCLDRLGITEPYAIQAATLPDVLAGRDVVAQSPTGSGKTLAFALPLVSHIGRAEPRRPRGLVLAPTRELAAQIADTIEPLANVVGRRVTCVYGGVGYRPQLKELYRGVDIVVGCPGRLGDLRERGAIDLSAVEVLVIDEADRMADMGFLPEVERLVKTIEGRHQTMLFSATLAGSVERLVSTYQHNPVRHVLALPVHDVGTRSHEFRRTARENRNDVTSELVATVGSSIVFCRTKHGVDRLAKHLTRQGLAVAAIHGDRSQAQRDHALAQFRNGHARALVGTDVASRGLHVDGVDCVIHFDAPEDEDTYVHRSGRTGRAGASGRVISLVMPQNERDALRLEQRFGAASHQPSAEPAAPAAVGGRQMSRARAATPAATGERRSTGPGRRGTEPSREPRWPVVGSNRAGAGRTERASRGARGPGSTSGATGPRVAWGNDAGDRKSSTTGTVKWFKSGKGFGFIAQDKGGPDVFVHHSAIEGDGYRNLEEGQRVRFDTTEGPKGLQASLVRPA